MEFLRSTLKKTPEYTALCSSIKGGRLPLLATGLSRIHKANLIDTLLSHPETAGLVVVSDEGEAVRLQEDLTAMGRQSLFYPAKDFCFRPVESVSREFERQRIKVLSALAAETDILVIASVDGLMTKTIPKQTLLSRILTIKTGDTLSPEKLAAHLIAEGYSRATQVEGMGQFAVRGGITDIFIPEMSLPVRIEFWGDEIDSIATFDTETQRRDENVKEIKIPPAREVLFSDPADFANKLKAFAGKLPEKQKKAADEILRDAEKIESGLSLSNMDKYLPLCYEKAETILDYADDRLIFVSEWNKVSDRVRSFHFQMDEDIKACLEDGILCRGLSGYTLGLTELLQGLENHFSLFMETFSTGSGGISFKDQVNFNLKTMSAFSGLAAELAEDLKANLSMGYGCVILAGADRAAMALCDNLRDLGLPTGYSADVRDIPAGYVTVTTGGLSAGIEYTDLKIAVYSHGRAVTAAVKKRRKNVAKGAFISSLEELKKGDLVVHSIYGIGIFDGIHKIETDGISKDYIKIRYLKDDVLYVPVTQLDLVTKYTGAGEDSGVRLSRLGSDGWQKTKARVKHEVKDMAKELIALYAKRMKLEGHAFAEDTDLQHDFEMRFPYDETGDQLRCIDEIKADMERSIPMDRLLCGDVGFGKTEVALRAAFKCICEGKQCALLVPTTILAWQHYKTVLARMEGLPITADMISRFRPAAEQQKIKKRLAKGEIDLIIGTHRLISTDIQFKDLGLLIVDEEQRFGVAQKEKLKERFPMVDVLTLSATPIPRTLNMAMSGLRDMSALEEAPHDRHPIQTYVMEFDRGVLLDTIRKELYRGGQVYYLHNRVETIERTAARLQADLPDAKIGIAHGQMSEDELSEKWRGLIDGDIDVLVCTTIIETGVDVSNVNTLVIEDADRFGLAQLHQLRGRVGRSARRAYAYLTFRRGKALSDIASKRLEALREYTEFGSGFRIAMRDLEIRGAGNVLGAKQHGQMESVGYDMYLKLLNDAVLEEQGKEPIEETECLVDLQVSANIPESYIENLATRLQIYRRIAEIKTPEDTDDVFDELIDRFGEPPKAVLGLIDIALQRNRAKEAGITEISDKGTSLLLYPKTLNMEMASKLAAELKGRVMISAGERPYIAVRAQKGKKPIDTLSEILDIYTTP